MFTAPNNLFDIIISRENIEAAIHEAAKCKMKDEGTEAARVLEEPKKYIEDIHNKLKEGIYEFSNGRQFVINEHSPTKKVRVIKKPRFICDQIVHHCIIRVISPYILRSLYTHTYGSLPERGVHKAKNAIYNYIKESREKNLPVYCFKADFHHYYESIDKCILLNRLRRLFGKDERLMYYLEKIIYTHKEPGIPLGYYTSVWFSMLYATDYDHFICSIKPKNSFYGRYMDDTILLAHDSNSLHEVRKQASKYIQDTLNIEYKDDYKVFKLYDFDKHGQYLVSLGFKFSMKRVELRDSNYKSLLHTLNQVRNSDFISIKQAKRLLSKIGLLSHTDSHILLKNIYSSDIMKKLKREVNRDAYVTRSYRYIRLTRELADKMLSYLESEEVA